MPKPIPAYCPYNQKYFKYYQYVKYHCETLRQVCDERFSRPSGF
jgi:hypothetical protein